MFNIGMPEIIVILIVAILVIGPKRLPEVASALGKGLTEFKRAMNSVKEELKIDEVRNDVNEMKDSLLFKNSYLDEEKEEKKGLKFEIVDKDDNRTDGDNNTPAAPSTKPDSGK